MRHAPRIAGTLLTIALVASGCGGAEDTAGERAADGADGRRAPVSDARFDVRSVVYTADLTVSVGDAGDAAERATRVATDAGGYVFAQRSDLEGRKEARLTLKVPPDRFESVLAAVAGLGRTLERDTRAQDVTEEVVDVDGRLKTAQVSADRLRVLLGEAGSTADIVGVEAELAKRESEIESLQGRQRVLGSQVDLATINVRLTERAALEVTQEVPGFFKAVRTGWVALLSVLLVVIAVAGFAVPFVPLGVTVWWVLRRFRRRRAAGLPRPPRPPSVPPSSPSPSPGGGPGEGSRSVPDSTPAGVG